MRLSTMQIRGVMGTQCVDRYRPTQLTHAASSCSRQQTKPCEQQQFHALRNINCLKSKTTADTILYQKRALLLGVSSAAAAGLLGSWSPASASVKLTISRKPQLKQYKLKAGYRVTVPDTWALAYDRSDSAELGTQVFFGDFKTFQTLSIFRLQLPASESGAGFNPEQLLETVIADQRDNQSTYGFSLISGPEPTPRTPDVANDNPCGTTFYDSEYELAICRGLLEEGSAGRRRCVGPNDMDLQIVSRHFYQTLVQQGQYIYVVRGSSTTDMWEDVGPTAIQAVQSFRLAAT